MQKFILSLGIILLSIPFYAQTISGSLKDRDTKEPLIGAAVTIGTLGAITDFEGNYSVSLPKKGKYTIVYSYVGYNNETVTMDIEGDIVVDKVLSPIVLNEVVIVSDIAKARETPVAFSNISALKIKEELASQDMPMILNSTPGVYATRSGGGDGDARITIRGFNQRNVAVMLDGVPVNDMENGWVYWSNWFGLDLVTQTMQVQRGLGASKLSIPSVGGTVNILTKGIDNKQSVQFQQEVANNNYFRTTFGYNSGRLKGNWGISLAGSYKQGDGYVRGNYTKGYFYYLRIDKQVGKHLFTLSGFGSPQEHGQRSFSTSIATIDSSYATDLGVVINDPNRSNYLGYNRGLQYNQHWGYRNGQLFNSTINYYHKPQYSFRHSWQPSNLFFLSNVVYLSIGNGGGTGFYGDGLSSSFYNSDGQIDFDTIQLVNQKSAFAKPAGKSNRIIRSSNNNHFWYGLLSTMKYEINKKLDLSGGVDARYYRGDHYRTVYDLLGGSYFSDDKGRWNSQVDNGKQQLQIGDKINYDNSGFVRWGGAFALLEYKQTHYNAFLNVSGAITSYRFEDYFKPEVVEVNGTTLLVTAEKPVTYNGTTYTINSPEASLQKIDWINIPNFTIKTGGSYKFDKQQSVFINIGYINKAQRFNNVIYTNNQGNRIAKANNYENEKILAYEGGYSFKSKKLSVNVNGYVTNWQNKPLDSPIALRDPSDPQELIPINIPGIDALHIGVESEIAFKVNEQLTLEGLCSIGDWKWNSGSTVNVNYRDTSFTYDFDAKGVHVGDAAQLQFGGMIRYEPIKGLYFKAKGIWFGKNYAYFNPENLQGVNGGRDSWKLPNYTLLDFHTGYSFNVKQTNISLRLNILNVLDTHYISDATNNDTRAPGNTTQGFDAQSASVFFGLGRQWNASIGFSF